MKQIFAVPLLFTIYNEAMVKKVCHKCAIGMGKDSQHDMQMIRQ